MCSQIQGRSKENDERHLKEVSDKDQALSNKTSKQNILLQTLVVRLINKITKNEIKVRALVDTGSQHSYLSQNMANKIGYIPNGKEKMNHCLFGGVEDIRSHNRYKIHLSNLSRDYFCNFDVYDQDKICSEIPKIEEGDWVNEAKQHGIHLSDLDQSYRSERPYDNEIHVLIGADVYGKLLTGKVIQLKSGVVAIQSRLGWALMGKLPVNRKSNETLSAMTLFSSERKISDLWDLDVLGISDPAEKQTKRELEEAAEEHFLASLKRESDGRYEVSLPWLSSHPPLPTNRQISENRLKSTVKKLKSSENLQAYEDVLKEWEDEGIIETVDDNVDDENCHYLPHRAVIREHSTTKVRPVFDASAKEKNSVSLNDCLESGTNYLELIPSILNRFRLNKYGVIADIRKAFLQISVNPQDRDFLRFLWWERGNPQNLKIYRHKRVVFGVNASPFLLAATLNYHLDNAPKNFQITAAKLKNSFYVDNCVTSVKTAEDLNNFISQSREIMSLALFDLRGWRHNDQESTSISFEDVSETDKTDVILSSEKDEVSVLGLKWDVTKDTLRCSFEDNSTITEITKRKILSIAHKIFDPIGYTIPVTLIPKLILQQCWKLKLNWDTKLPNDIEKKFLTWVKQLETLKMIEIPRKLPEINENSTLHVFCDASNTAYATCIFLRSDENHAVKIQLVQARAKVTPLKSISMPRLELLACNIGARLAQSVKKDLKIENIRTYYWSDAIDAIYWIKRDENWATFVANRVKEIRSISDKRDWHYIPGKMNPADLPSRGCSVKALEKSRWWEGPEWLYEDEENWPSTEIVPDFDVINSERKKTVVSAVNTNTKREESFNEISNYNKILRIISLIFRFTKNCKLASIERIRGKITTEEIKKAEIVLLKLIQRDSFEGLEDKKLSTLQPIIDSEGLIRIKSRISRRDDLENFRFPVVLPSDHPLVFKLIRNEHESMNHIGVQNLMANLRERFWILKCRKTVRNVVQKCIRCKRFSVKPAEILSPPLPEDRIRDANVFEITGIDLCGPLFLRDGRKCWIVLFTCAVFRAVHLEITTSLSTDGFLQALRRFIARRGRPHIIYSDNGTNFIGARRELNSINWGKIQDYATTRRIEWKLNPPAAPWWGGFWERLIGILKSILRKIIGKASLKLEELYTIICDAESTMNQRPLTYISEDSTDLMALTPEMFLKDIRDTGVPDLDNIDKVSMNRRFSYRQKLRDNLRQRFRSEYLGFLRETRKRKTTKILKEGDIVLMDDGNSKRINWPLAKIVKLYPGKDGHFRLAKLKTRNGEVLRPCQRLCPLEIHDDEVSNLRSKIPLVPGVHLNENEQKKNVPKHIQTRYGRTVQPVNRLGCIVAS